MLCVFFFFFFFFNDTATTEIYTLSLHDALPILQKNRKTVSPTRWIVARRSFPVATRRNSIARSEEHTSELQSRRDLVCRLLLEKKKKKNKDCSLRHQQTQDKSIALYFRRISLFS